MGFGFLESVYEKCLLIEIRKAGLDADSLSPLLRPFKYEDRIRLEFYRARSNFVLRVGTQNEETRSMPVKGNALNAIRQIAHDRYEVSGHDEPLCRLVKSDFRPLETTIQE